VATIVLDAPPIALIIHGWNDDPASGWLDWLNAQLMERGYDVRAPHLQIGQRSLLRRWNNQIRPFANELNQQSIVVAHSLGCFLTLRMLEAISLDDPINQVILVSGFYDAPNDAASKFFTPEPDWTRIKEQAQKFICIYSNDDTIVTPDRTRRLSHKLDAELIMLADKGHFLGSRGLETLPEILEFIE
jgi:predicted alpha/beta hydrolase family esterase